MARNHHPLSLRILALFLSVGIALPTNPAFALRQAGLEENAALGEFLAQITPDGVRAQSGLEELPPWVAQELWSSFFPYNAGKPPYVVQAQGDLGTVRHQVRDGLRQIPSAEPFPGFPHLTNEPFVAVTLRVEYPNRTDHILVIDRVGHIRGRIARITAGDIALEEYEFAVHLSVYPPFHAVHFHTITLGRELEPELRGKGLAAASFARIAAKLIQDHPSMEISTVAASGRVKSWFVQYFQAHFTSVEEYTAVNEYVRIPPADAPSLLIGRVTPSAQTGGSELSQGSAGMEEVPIQEIRSALSGAGLNFQKKIGDPQLRTLYQDANLTPDRVMRVLGGTLPTRHEGKKKEATAGIIVGVFGQVKAAYEAARPAREAQAAKHGHFHQEAQKVEAAYRDYVEHHQPADAERFRQAVRRSVGHAQKVRELWRAHRDLNVLGLTGSDVANAIKAIPAPFSEEELAAFEAAKEWVLQMMFQGPDAEPRRAAWRNRIPSPQPVNLPFYAEHKLRVADYSWQRGQPPRATRAALVEEYYQDLVNWFTQADAVATFPEDETGRRTILIVVVAGQPRERMMSKYVHEIAELITLEEFHPRSLAERIRLREEWDIVATAMEMLYLQTRWRQLSTTEVEDLADIRKVKGVEGVPLPRSVIPVLVRAFENGRHLNSDETPEELARNLTLSVNAAYEWYELETGTSRDEFREFSRYFTGAALGGLAYAAGQRRAAQPATEEESVRLAARFIGGVVRGEFRQPLHEAVQRGQAALGAGLEETETARAQLRNWLRNPNISGILPTLRDHPETDVDLVPYFPEIRELLAKAGYDQGTARYIPMNEKPAALLEQPVAIYVQEGWEGQAQVRKNLKDAENLKRVVFVDKIGDASIVIGDETVRIEPNQTLLQVADPAAARLVTEKLLAYLQRNGFLVAGAIIAVNQLTVDELDEDVVIFA